MKTLKLNSKDYKVAEFNDELTNKLFYWAKAQLKDPVDEVMKYLPNLSPALQAVALKDALEKQRIPLNYESPEIQSECRTPEGGKKTLELMWKTHHPELKSEEITTLTEDAIKKYSQNFMQLPQKVLDDIDKFLLEHKFETFQEASKLSEFDELFKS